MLFISSLIELPDYQCCPLQFPSFAAVTMWMIDTTTFRLNDDWRPLEYFMNGNGYAILSHRWQGTELSFQEIKRGVPSPTQAYEKIISACNEARFWGCQWLWVDTCCINKESQTELAEAINSMFQWYLKAAICLGFLVDVETGGMDDRDQVNEPGVFRKIGSEMWQASEWFSRGKLVEIEEQLYETSVCGS